MRYSSQNLTDGRLSKFWHGRAWLRPWNYNNPRGRTIHWEWSFGKLASDFAAKISFGDGDGDDGILFHLCIPWLFSIFFGWDRFLRCKECQCGIAIHNQAIWFYPLSYSMKHNSSDPWYRKTHYLNFPWQLDHYNTQILGHVRYGLDMPVEWSEREGGKKKRFKDSYDERKAAEVRVSREYHYSYILKNRTIQNTIATVHVDRMEWRARWWPFIPKRKVRTSISVSFKNEIGEDVHTWKGGCIGCGLDMKWGETPEQTLRRMEHTVTF